MHKPLLPCLLFQIAGCSDYAYQEYELSDVFYQTAADAVDILLVVDNSHSMGPYQERFGASFDSFLVFFGEAQVDYRIGVTTTDTFHEGAGAIGAERVSPTTEDAATVFQRIVNVGTTGSGTEMGMEAARRALEADGDGFLRPDAYLSVIVVSDEEDSSPLSVNEYVTRFRALKPRDRDAFRFSAATVFDRAACVPVTDEGTPGSRYVLAATASGGASEDLCAEDFTSVLTRLSLNTSRLRDTFVLSDEPKASSLRLEIDEEVVGCEGDTWSLQVLDAGGERVPAVVFAPGHLPPLGAEIALFYNRGTASANEFCTGAAR